MINENSIEFYNNRLTYDFSNIKNLSPQQQDRIRSYGSQAENLLKNRDLAMFVHHFKFQLADELIEISGHTEVDNTKRIALSNELRGIDSFVSSLKKAVYYKNKLGNAEVAPE
jgi:hypothetical protein